MTIGNFEINEEYCAQWTDLTWPVPIWLLTIGYDESDFPSTHVEEVANGNLRLVMKPLPASIFSSAIPSQSDPEGIILVVPPGGWRRCS
jgi:hypothetical protein